MALFLERSLDNPKLEFNNKIMEEIQKPGEEETLTPEEQIAEDEALKETPDDEIKKSIIETYGFDEEIDTEVISKLVEKRKEEQKNLSTAISQKRKWREKAQKGEKPEEKPQVQPVEPKEEQLSVSQVVQGELEKRDIDSLELSDELKEEVKSYAKLNNVSVKKAFNSDYIQFKKGKEDEKATTENASIKSTHKTMANSNFSKMTPADFDLSTEEGREDYKGFKAWVKGNIK